MKTKSFFSSAIIMLAMSMSVSAQYVRDPTLCNGMDASWDATARTFTAKNLKAGIQAPWIAWVVDPTWASGDAAYVDITDYSFTPGSTTATSLRLEIKHGDPTKGGTNGVSALDVAIKSVNNNFPKGTKKAEDCFALFDGTHFSGVCKGVAPLYCDKFDLKFDNNTLTLSGLNNCVTYNNYLFQNADYTDWAMIPLSFPDPNNKDVAVCDVKDVKWNGSKTNVYPFQEGTSAYMNSNDKGGGPAGQIKPGYCSKKFDCPVGGEVSVNEVAVKSVVAYPNPAVASEIVTVSGSFDADTKVSILGVNGQLVSRVIPSKSDSGISFAAPAIGAGIYVVKIESASAVSTAMLLIK